MKKTSSECLCVPKKNKFDNKEKKILNLLNVKLMLVLYAYRTENIMKKWKIIIYNKNY